MRIRLIGVGTPHGDDAAGPAVIEALVAAGLPAGVAATTCARPGLDLPEALSGAQAAVLVDAMRSGRSPGSVARVPRDQLGRLRSLSSHGLGVAEGLALAEALGRCPPRIEVVGIEGDRHEGDELSPAVRRGVARAASMVREMLCDLASESEGREA